jgi:hypothetical protein
VGHARPAWRPTTVSPAHGHQTVDASMVACRCSALDRRAVVPRGQTPDAVLTADPGEECVVKTAKHVWSTSNALAWRASGLHL